MTCLFLNLKCSHTWTKKLDDKETCRSAEQQVINWKEEKTYEMQKLSDAQKFFFRKAEKRFTS